jgi:hypothetical protein
MKLVFLKKVMADKIKILFKKNHQAATSPSFLISEAPV